MYTGYLLSEKSRSQLLAQFPPKYEKVVAHHITEQFGTPPDAPAPPTPNSVEVVGYIDSGDGVEGLLVAINGSVERQDGSRYHITWSLAPGRKPVETNKYVFKATSVNPISIEVTPKNFGAKLASLKESLQPGTLKEMTFLAGGYPAEKESKYTLELVRSDGKRIGNIDKRDIYALSHAGTIIYASGKDDKMVTFVQCKDVTIDGDSYLQLLVAYCLPEFRNQGETTRLLWFVKSQEGKHLIDYGSVTKDGMKFYNSLYKTGRHNIYWLNVKTGDKEDFVKFRNSALSKTAVTDWRIVIEGKDAHPFPRFIDECDNLNLKLSQLIESSGP